MANGKGVHIQMKKRLFYGIKIVFIIVTSMNIMRPREDTQCMHSVRSVPEVAVEAERAVVPVSHDCGLAYRPEPCLHERRHLLECSTSQNQKLVYHALME